MRSNFRRIYKSRDKIFLQARAYMFEWGRELSEYEMRQAVEPLIGKEKLDAILGKLKHCKDNYFPVETEKFVYILNYQDAF